MGHSERWPAKVAMLLGNASYSIYLFHLHMLSATLGVFARLVPGAPADIAIAASALAATGFGVLVHLFVERPLLRMTTMLVRRQKLARGESYYESLPR